MLYPVAVPVPNGGRMPRGAIKRRIKLVVVDEHAETRGPRRV
jgi:hypothetical protein